jgi:hypothetical protein
LTSSYLRRSFGYRATRQDVTDAVKQLDPAGVDSRRPGLRTTRVENYITAGPNFLWSLDGHDKLVPYGIQIYAAIDAYSRKIICSYCGIANRSQLSVLKLHLHAVKAYGTCPNFIRTDKGTETVLLAEAHYSQYIEAANREGFTNEEFSLVDITDFYIYGTSARNIRIERLWRQQRDTFIGAWLS